MDLASWAYELRGGRAATRVPGGAHDLVVPGDGKDQVRRRRPRRRPSVREVGRGVGEGAMFADAVAANRVLG